MRYFALLMALFIAFPAFAKVRCDTKNAEVANAIRALTPEQPSADPYDSFAVFSAHPQESACLLVGELKVVRARIVKHLEVEQYPTAMRVVWALRALRTITGCQDFRAATSEHFHPESRDVLVSARGQFLGRKGPGNTPFFAVWMSRDMVFLAASDAQVAIIKKWQSWLSRSHDFVFTPCEDMNDWYF